MLKTLEGTLDPQGKIRFDEEFELVRPQRVLVTLLDNDTPFERPGPASLADLRAFMASPAFRNRPTGSAEALEALVEQTRNAWES
jgi:hypothetical protein